MAEDTYRWAARGIRFMPGCTHAGVPKGTNCPLCGDLVR